MKKRKNYIFLKQSIFYIVLLIAVAIVIKVFSGVCLKQFQTEIVSSALSIGGTAVAVLFTGLALFIALISNEKLKLLFRHNLLDPYINTSKIGVSIACLTIIFAQSFILISEIVDVYFTDILLALLFSLQIVIVVNFFNCTMKLYHLIELMKNDRYFSGHTKDKKE